MHILRPLDLHNYLAKLEQEKRERTIQGLGF